LTVGSGGRRGEGWKVIFEKQERIIDSVWGEKIESIRKRVVFIKT
jgi:hypothetical protein